MEPDDNQLQGMDLVKRGPNDSKLENKFDWCERDSIHNELESSTLVENRPSHNKFFERAEQTTLSNITCNLAVSVLKFTAVVIRGNTDGTNKRIQAEYTWAMIEAAEWNKKYSLVNVFSRSNKLRLI